MWYKVQPILFIGFWVCLVPCSPDMRKIVPILQRIYEIYLVMAVFSQPVVLITCYLLIP